VNAKPSSSSSDHIYQEVLDEKFENMHMHMAKFQQQALGMQIIFL
jgi:hypothetical protein